MPHTEYLLNGYENVTKNTTRFNITNTFGLTKFGYFMNKLLLFETCLVYTWYMVGCNFLWYKLVTGCLAQVGAWLMHLFMVQIDIC